MSEPIRVLHFADVHIGMENYGRTDPDSGLSSRAQDFLTRLDETIDFAENGDVDLAIFAGDAFRSRSPNPTYQREFAERALRLSQLAPLVLLVGHHDLPRNAAKASSLEIYAALNVPNVIVAQDYAAQRIATKRGDVVVGTAPYPVRARVLPGNAGRGASMEAGEAELRQAMERLLDKIGARAEELAEESTPRLLTGHFGLIGAQPGSEAAIMLGRDPVFALEAVARTCWDYVAMGHIHRHQNLTASQPALPPVVYSGSLERIDFGEERDAKGFCWVELLRGEAKWRFIELPARKLRTLSVDCRALENPTAVALAAIRSADLCDAVVRLELRLTPESEALLNDGLVVKALKGAGVFHIAGISKAVDRPARARLGASPEGLGPLELLERYFEAREIDEARREQLLKLAAGIVAEES